MKLNYQLFLKILMMNASLIVLSSCASTSPTKSIVASTQTSNTLRNPAQASGGLPASGEPQMNCHLDGPVPGAFYQFPSITLGASGTSNDAFKNLYPLPGTKNLALSVSYSLNKFPGYVVALNLVPYAGKTQTSAFPRATIASIQDGTAIKTGWLVASSIVTSPEGNMPTNMEMDYDSTISTDIDSPSHMLSVFCKFTPGTN